MDQPAWWRRAQQREEERLSGRDMLGRLQEKEEDFPDTLDSQGTIAAAVLLVTQEEKAKAPCRDADQEGFREGLRRGTGAPRKLKAEAPDTWEEDGTGGARQTAKKPQAHACGL